MAGVGLPTDLHRAPPLLVAELPELAEGPGPSPEAGRFWALPCLGLAS